jgi:hypothetical protein
MNNQNKEEKRKEESNFWNNDIFILIRSIGYLLMLFGCMGMFGNNFSDTTPFALFGLGIVLYLIGKEVRK